MDQVMEEIMMAMLDAREIQYVAATIVENLVLTTMKKTTVVRKQSLEKVGREHK